MLQAVRNVGGQIPAVAVGQEVVHGVTLGDRTVVLQCVDIVVGSANAEAGFQQTGSNEHQSRRNNQLAGLSGNQQATLVCPSGDLDNGILKRSLVQVSVGRWAVAVGATGDQRVGCAEQSNAVAANIVGRETVVDNRRSFNLLGVRHSASQGLGVTSRQGVVQVIFHSLFRDGEAQGNGLVVVPSGERFLRIVISNGRALVLHWCSTEAGQLGFFFKATLRFLGFVEFLVLFAVTGVFQTEQSVQSGEQLFK